MATLQGAPVRSKLCAASEQRAFHALPVGGFSPSRRAAIEPVLGTHRGPATRHISISFAEPL